MIQSIKFIKFFRCHLYPDWPPESDLRNISGSGKHIKALCTILWCCMISCILFQLCVTKSLGWPSLFLPISLPFTSQIAPCPDSPPLKLKLFVAFFQPPLIEVSAEEGKMVKRVEGGRRGGEFFYDHLWEGEFFYTIFERESGNRLKDDAP